MPTNSSTHAAKRFCSIVAIAWLTLISARETGGQAITLPTVRTFGPGPEEAVLHRLIREVRADYSKDTLPDAGGATGSGARETAFRLLPRLDRLSVASLSWAQLWELQDAESTTDSLEVLAGSQHLADDPVPRGMLDALRRLAGEASSPCALLGESDRNSVSKELATRSTGADTASTEVRSISKLGCIIRRLYVAEGAPSLLLSSIRSDAVARQENARAARLDTLARVATAVVILRKVNGRIFAPVTSREQAAAFWRQQGLAPLNVGSISGSGKAGVAFTELASPLLQAVRVSVNAVLAAAQTPQGGVQALPPSATGGATSAPEDPPSGPASSAAIQRLLTAGGLFNVSFAWPFAQLDNRDGNTGVIGLIVPRFGVTAPVLGTPAADSTTLNADIGFELHAKVLDLVDGVGLIAQTRFATTRGSQQFVESLGVAGKRQVSYGSASFGFLFGRQYLVTASRAIIGPKVIREAPWQIGLTVVRLPTSP